jgi:hypothetical protein
LKQVRELQLTTLLGGPSNGNFCPCISRSISTKIILIQALQFSHTTSGTYFTLLDDFCKGLGGLNKLKGLPYGGAAPMPKNFQNLLQKKPNQPWFCGFGSIS